jgi:hypothetical protein
MITDRESIDYLDTVPHFWSDADAIEQWLEARPGQWFNPSTIRRGAKVQGDVYRVLKWLDRNRYVAAHGNGCWRKYAARDRFASANTSV